jgi:hypothetical protein
MAVGQAKYATLLSRFACHAYKPLEMQYRILLLLPICLLPIHADDGMSPAAQAYLDGALAVMQEHFLHKDKVDWPRLKQETVAQAAGAQTAIDTYPAIRFALARLGDHHSYLQLTPDLSRQEGARKPKLANPAAMPPPRTRKQSFPFPSPFRTRRVPEAAMLTGSTCPIAQIVIPLFGSQDRQEIDQFATNVQRAIAELTFHDPRAWIVDLRGNGGGNAWAMMAGIGPILGEGEWGASLQGDGTVGRWYYEDGKAGWRNDAKDPTMREPPPLPSNSSEPRPSPC